jgi:hypothetical protein
MKSPVLLLLSLSAVSAWVTPPLSRHAKGLKAAVTLDGEVIRGEITPLGSYVIVRTKDTLTASEGGILLPDQVGFVRIPLNYFVDLYLMNVLLTYTVVAGHGAPYRRCSGGSWSR